MKKQIDRRLATVVFILALTCISCDLFARRPNIVLLFADDLGYGELGCQGNREIPTPSIDSLARDGVRFRAGYVAASYCSVSRAGLMTGRFPTRFGYEFNPIGAHNEDPNVGLPGDQLTISKHLHDAGYTTALIGKWHLGGAAPYHPFRRGFDEFFGFLHEGHYFVPPPYRGVTTMLRRRTLPTGQKGRWVSPDGRLIYSTHMGYDEPAYDANNPILRGGQPVEEKEHLTDAITREAVDVIKRCKDRPFFLFVSYNAVHSPLQGDQRYMKELIGIDDVHRRIFAAMLRHMDDSVGTILKALDDEGLSEETLVVFLSDNGGPTRELTSSNRPLRGEKGDVFEGGIRVPFIMRWTNVLQGGTVVDAPISALDLLPTAAAIAERPLPKKVQVDGINLLPFLTGKRKSMPQRTLFWRQRARTAIRVGDWKLLRNPRRNSSNAWQLYQVSDDIGEQKNLAELQPAKLKEMQAHWQSLNEQMQEPFWKPIRR